jgi:hypothetical protein
MCKLSACDALLEFPLGGAVSPGILSWESSLMEFWPKKFGLFPPRLINLMEMRTTYQATAPSGQVEDICSRIMYTVRLKTLK